MNAFDLYLIVLKIALSVQFILILMKKQSDTSIAFLISDMIFKISIGVFLLSFFIFNKVLDMDMYNKMIISFAGVILIYDAIYFDLPKILIQYNIEFNPYTYLQNLSH